MPSSRPSDPVAAPLRGSRALRRRQRIVTRRHLPPLRLVTGNGFTGDERPPTPRELVADLMTLIDAGLIGPLDTGESVRYVPVEPNAFAAGAIESEIADPFAGTATTAMANHRREGR